MLFGPIFIFGRMKRWRQTEPRQSASDGEELGLLWVAITIFTLVISPSVRLLCYGTLTFTSCCSMRCCRRCALARPSGALNENCTTSAIWQLPIRVNLRWRSGPPRR